MVVDISVWNSKSEYSVLQNLFFPSLFKIFFSYMNVDPIHSIPHVLKYWLERHEQTSALDSRLLPKNKSTLLARPNRFQLSQTIWVNQVSPCVLSGVGEEINQTSQQISFWKVEKRIQDVDPGLVQLEKFVRIKFVHLRTEDIFKLVFFTTTFVLFGQFLFWKNGATKLDWELFEKSIFFL